MESEVCHQNMNRPTGLRAICRQPGQLVGQRRIAVCRGRHMVSRRAKSFRYLFPVVRSSSLYIIPQTCPVVVAYVHVMDFPFPHPKAWVRSISSAPGFGPASFQELLQLPYTRLHPSSPDSHGQVPVSSGRGWPNC